VAGVAILQLEASEFAGPGRWLWTLTGPGKKFLADHQVDLDVSRWEFEAFTDLQGYLYSHTAPDQWLEEEASVLAGVGAWAGEHVLGAVGAALAGHRGPVRVTVKGGEPPEAEQVLFWPLELAHVKGKPLAARGVTLVMDPPGADAVTALPVADRLRVLGLFSLPTGGMPLNLRRERQALVDMFAEIAGDGRAVEVRVLQYGVTRDRLQEVLEDAEGWDVIHISGHGAPGELALETEEGAADPVTAAELVEMVQTAGADRVKLVSVSACWSAAMTLAEQRRLLRLPAPGDARGGPPAGDGGAAAGGVAVELAARLGCAVLAMRFPVVDDFAIGLAERFYGLVAGKGQPVARAVGIALADPKVVAVPPTLDCPPLSVVTPAVFGAAAVDLRLKAPNRAGPVTVDPRLLRLAGFPPQPDLFVGRTGVMARASAALAPRSKVPGVLLHGMPGGGKTACALELAYTHEHAFEVLVWFKAPDTGLEIADALARFALTLENRLPGLQMVHLLEDPATAGSGGWC
jgi:CHAT domain-containing protein